MLLLQIPGKTCVPIPYLEQSDKNWVFASYKKSSGLHLSNRNFFSFSKILKVRFYISSRVKKTKKGEGEGGGGDFPCICQTTDVLYPYTAKACIPKMDLNIFRYIFMFVLFSIFLFTFSSLFPEKIYYYPYFLFLCFLWSKYLAPPTAAQNLWSSFFISFFSSD